MIGDLVSFLKWLTSKEFGDFVGKILPLWKRSHGWKEEGDILVRTINIRKDKREIAIHLGTDIGSKMQAANFSSKDISRFLDAFYELAENGFNHGCDRGSDSVAFRVTILKIGVIAEVTNNNRSKIIPDMETIRSSKVQGTTGLGLRRASSIGELTPTPNRRGLKLSFSKSYQIDEPVHDDVTRIHDGITIVQIGALTTNVAKLVNRALEGRSDYVILVCGPETHGSMAARASAETESSDPVKRFAIVAGEHMWDVVLDRTEYLPKLLGCYHSVTAAKDAIYAEWANPQKSPPSKVVRHVPDEFDDDVHNYTPNPNYTRSPVVAAPMSTTLSAAFELVEKNGAAATDAIPILIETLGDPNHGPGAAAALSRIQPAAIPALVRALIQDSDSAVRRRAAFAIGNMGQAAAEAVPDLARAAEDDADERVRANAKEALDIIHGPRANAVK